MILSECGKCPLILKVYVQIIRYWFRLITSSNAHLTEVRRLEEQKLKEGKNSWLKIVDFLIRYLSDDTLDSLLKKNDDI